MLTAMQLTATRAPVVFSKIVSQLLASALRSGAHCLVLGAANHYEIIDCLRLENSPSKPQ